MRRTPFAPSHAHVLARFVTRIAPALGLVLGALAQPVLAQQVVGHVSLLPAQAGLNPIAPGRLVTNPTTAEVFLLHTRGATALVPGVSPAFVNYQIGDEDLSSPYDLVLDSVLQRVYVTDAGDDTLVVLDRAKRVVLARVPVGFAVGRLALDTTTGTIYVLSRSSTELTAIHAGSLETLALSTLPMPGDRVAVDSANAKVYVTSALAAATYVLDPDLSIRATLTTGAQSSALAVNPVAGKVYVVNDGIALHVIDAATDVIAKTITPANVSMVVADTTTGKAYAAGATGDVTVIDAASNATAVAITATPSFISATGLAIDEAGKHLFVGDQIQLLGLLPLSSLGLPGVARITTLDLTPATPTNQGTALTGRDGSSELAWSPANGRLYIADTFLTAVSEFNPTTRTARSIPIGCALEGGVTNDAAGLSFTIDAASSQVAMVDTTAAPPALGITTKVGDLPFLSAISAIAPVGGGQVYVVNEVTRSISVLDAAAGTLIKTKTMVPHDYTPGFAVDRTLAAGPKAFLTNLPGDTPTVPLPTFVESYNPAPSTLNPISSCGLVCGILGVAMDTDETAHRAYATSVFFTPAQNIGVSIWNSTSDAFVKNLQIPGGDAFPSVVLQADAAHAQVYVPQLETPRVVAIKDGATPTFTDIPTTAAAVPTGLALDSTAGRLYVAEGNDGQVEIVDTTSNTLVPPLIATGGAPTSIFAQSGTGRLWIANDFLSSPSVQVADPSSTGLAVLSDLAYLGVTRAFSGRLSGRVSFADNRHGSVAVLDPAAVGTDLQIDPLALPDGVPNTVYTGVTLTATGGAGPSFRWEVVSGMLPPGLMLDATTGVIDGTPTQAGIFSFMVRLSDLGASPLEIDVEDFQIQVLGLTIVTLSVPAAGCTPYSVTLLAAGGTPPYTWTAGPTLPSWLTLDPSGILSGLATGPGSCPADQFNVTVMDSLGVTVMRQLCVAVGGGGSVPLVGNNLRAVKAGATRADVTLVMPPPAGLAGYNVYRAPTKLAVKTRIPPGGPTPPSTTTATYVDIGAVTDPSSKTFFYAVRAVDACGAESTE